MKYVALLRGINVGGNSKVEMKRLKQLFEKNSYKNVTTYINSGNIIFDSSKNKAHLTSEIERLIEQEFDFRVSVLVRDQTDILKLVKELPKEWKNDSEQKTDILFLWPTYDNQKSLELLAPVSGVDTLIYLDGAIIWHLVRKDYNKSAMRKFIGTVLYKNMTARNINTVRKLASLMN